MLNMLIWPPCNKCYKLQFIVTWIKLPGFFLKAQYMEHIKTHTICRSYNQGMTKQSNSAIPTLILKVLMNLT